MERTLIIFKPDAMHRLLVGRILARFEDKGLRIAALKLQQSPRAQVERHYAVHHGKPFYDALVQFMTSGPVIVGVLEGPSAIVKGGRPLSGAPVMASDLRASAALVIAGLAARGTTQVNRVYHLDRGYEQMDVKLRKLGARVQRIEET